MPRIDIREAEQGAGVVGLQIERSDGWSVLRVRMSPISGVSRPMRPLRMKVRISAAAPDQPQFESAQRLAMMAEHRTELDVQFDVIWRGLSSASSEPDMVGGDEIAAVEDVAAQRHRATCRRPCAPPSATPCRHRRGVDGKVGRANFALADQARCGRAPARRTRRSAYRPGGCRPCRARPGTPPGRPAGGLDPSRQELVDRHRRQVRLDIEALCLRVADAGRQP